MFKRILHGTLFAAIALGAAGAQAQGTATATLKDAGGQTVGEVLLTEGGYGTLLQVTLRGLPPGTHAFHVHAVGTCEPPFTSAGGHYNPTGSKHGFLDRDGMHAGDLPNVHVPSSGELKFDVFAPRVRLDAALFDADGAAIVMHQGADDYKSDPAGAAGPRIACGVIEKM
ncbi:MAG: superoxide dismutase family protein [Gammaproteobacteria bacterium]|nr:superoxide dismutase family protein [Gammaproteobacteria bacterium]